ncbi:hypothetical protein ACIA5C_48120 [Actinoplanes sp. NPDC051343]|uniref:hypothetical protein n=1 Tax=Actinoplanes sp. NPDC051343 TaxID=3363906 RepID=UPI0037B69AC2
MVLSMVYDVNVSHDWFDILSLIAGFGGLAAALVALKQARRAQHTANHAITDERRRQFELEILRDLAKDLDAGLAKEVWSRPTLLIDYAIRLDLLSTRLQFWGKIAVLKDYHEVSAAVGMPEYSQSERDRAAVADDVRVVQSASQAWVNIRETELAWEQLGPVDPEDRTMQIARQQQTEITQHTLQSIKRWVPNPPAFTEAQAWHAVEDRLKELIQELDVKAQEAGERMGRLRSEVQAELRRRLVWDVDQAIKSRVDARQHERAGWWGLVRQWWK